MSLPVASWSPLGVVAWSLPPLSCGTSWSLLSGPHGLVEALGKTNYHKWIN